MLFLLAGCDVGISRHFAPANIPIIIIIVIVVIGIIGIFATALKTVFQALGRQRVSQDAPPVSCQEPPLLRHTEGEVASGRPSAPVLRAADESPPSYYEAMTMTDKPNRTVPTCPPDYMA